VWVDILKTKSCVFDVIKEYRDLVEKITSMTIKCLRTNNGGELTYLEFEKCCKDARIKRHKTIIYTPHKNGMVECMNNTLVQRERNILSNAKMPQ
jgi:transposase InsO family protein